MFKLPILQYSKSALEPFMSSETMNYHYDKHYKAYIEKTNFLIRNTNLENSSLEDIIIKSDGALLNNASQAWNHSFFWLCINGSDHKRGAKIPDTLLVNLEKSFGSLVQFKKLFLEKALEQFGSGWVWLVLDQRSDLKIISLPNAESAFRFGLIPMLICDVWEHAYYIDYRNNRQQFVANFLSAVDWEFVAANLESKVIPNMTRLMT